MSVSLKAAIFLCFASLFWSGNFIVGRLSSVEELVSPLSLSFYRWVIALIILTPFCLKNALVDLPLLKKQPGMVFLIILTGPTLFNTLTYIGLTATTVINSLLVISTTPMLIILLNKLIYKNQTNLFQMLGVILSLIGVSYVITKGNYQNIFDSKFYTGDLFILLAVISWALYSIFLKKNETGVSGFSFLYLSFVFTVFVIGIDFGSIFSFSSFFYFPPDSILIIAGLIGTTVVPYNIFLHVALVNGKWKNKGDLKNANFDTIISILVGGLISLCILLTSAGLEKTDILNAVDLAYGLEPLYGNFSKYVVAIGLLSAGLTSSITAPIAAAYVVCGCLGLEESRKSTYFKIIAVVVLLVGVIFSSIGISPIEIIKFAQITNGILLPLIVIFLMFLANNIKLLKKNTNSTFQNIIGVVVICFCLLLCYRSIIKVFIQ